MLQYLFTNKLTEQIQIGMRQVYVLMIFSSFLTVTGLFGQPANDNCETATILTELSGWCSNLGAFSNVDATVSTYDAPDCFNDNNNDVWFSFVAGATDVSILVIGNTNVAPGGTLNNPEVALYSGICGEELSEWRCVIDDSFDNTVELRRAGLIVGQTYLIRVQGRSGNTGTFQLCINNFNPPALPGSDCENSDPELSAAVLCDKSPFSVQKLEGGGDNNDEARGSCLDIAGGGPSESSSTWFTWIAKTSGPLTFTLTPTRSTDDLDFVVYELPNGINDCSGKIILRCMATACEGPTGLDMASTDIEEDLNCDAGEDGFVRFIDMEEGKAYALMVNNFSDTGDGFSLEFGQDESEGEFVGPEADFITDEPDNQVCIGEDVEFTESSSFPSGQITRYQWTFGVGATPEFANGPGPHIVNYNSAGVKSIVLTLETDLGCIFTKISNFNVLADMVLTPVLTSPDCGGAANGSIEMQVVNGAAPYQFDWNNTGFQANNVLDNVSEGTYTVSVMDAEGCVQTQNIELTEADLSLEITSSPPSCNGFNDGEITINPTTGTPPYQFDLGSGFGNDNTLRNVAAGTYNFSVMDSEGCDGVISIDIEDPEVLSLQLNPVNISCNGLEDGTADVAATGGYGGYQFDWSTGESGSQIQNLAPGNYDVTLTDAGGCQIIEAFEIMGVQSVVLELVGSMDNECPNDANGSITVAANGGTPPYEFSIDNGSNFQSATSFENLGAGNYTILVRDSRGCSNNLENIVLTEPAAAFLSAGEDQVVNLGESIQLDAITDVTPMSFQWSGPDSIITPNSRATLAFPFNSGFYTVTMIDQRDCVYSDSLQVIVQSTRPIYIPNIFSPNGDGSNDRFTLYAGFAARRIKSLRVFTRWGDLVYEGFDLPLNNENFGWDGTINGEELNDGVFAFVAEVEYLDDAIVVFEGDITLIK